MSLTILNCDDEYQLGKLNSSYTVSRKLRTLQQKTHFSELQVPFLIFIFLKYIEDCLMVGLEYSGDRFPVSMTGGLN